MNSVAMLAETHPARAYGVTRARRDDFAIVLIGGVGHAALNGEDANRAWCGGLADGDGVDLLHLPVFNQG